MATLNNSVTVGNPFMNKYLSVSKSSQNDKKSEADSVIHEIRGRLNRLHCLLGKTLF